MLVTYSDGVPIKRLLPRRWKRHGNDSFWREMRHYQWWITLDCLILMLFIMISSKKKKDRQEELNIQISAD